ncbi:hypothetical protein CCZ01_09375 [Helicobacter monodelphidis]|uniref:hypothetical protein n=1 Tax=Helicobacter sp. 15-1451 TaxID=2004995 RepID=UPI000DCC7A25|nr:hypothetical protein [Helicobacter sp. 15-1451]RAX56495.1 hypothetical protein CCZ01_09375 [Helicobacter sp. 15-1451]
MMIKMTYLPYLFWFCRNIEIKICQNPQCLQIEQKEYLFRPFNPTLFIAFKYTIPFVFIVMVFNANDIELSVVKFLEFGFALSFVATLSFLDGLLRIFAFILTMLLALFCSVYFIDINFIPFALKYSVLTTLIIAFVFDLNISVFEIYTENGVKGHFFTKRGALL